MRVIQITAQKICPRLVLNNNAHKYCRTLIPKLSQISLGANLSDNDVFEAEIWRKRG